MYNVVLYEDAQGNCPVADLVADLNKRAKYDKRARVLLERIRYAIKRIEQSGTRSGADFTKQIDGKLWELRPGDHRIFFFGWKGSHFVLLHAFLKKSNKTPRREIDKAKSEMADWIQRNGQ